MSQNMGKLNKIIEKKMTCCCAWNLKLSQHVPETFLNLWADTDCS